MRRVGRASCLRRYRKVFVLQSQIVDVVMPHSGLGTSPASHAPMNVLWYEHMVLANPAVSQASMRRSSIQKPDRYEARHSMEMHLMSKHWRILDGCEYVGPGELLWLSQDIRHFLHRHVAQVLMGLRGLRVGKVPRAKRLGVQAEPYQRIRAVGVLLERLPNVGAIGACYIHR